MSANTPQDSAKAQQDTPELKPVPTPRSPGSTRRAVRVERAHAQFREQVRRQMINEFGEVDPVELEDEALSRLTALMEYQDPEVAKQLVATAPTSVSPRRDGLYSAVEVAAIRRTSMVTELEDALRSATMGRPSDRRLPLAIFEQMAFGMGRPVIREHLHQFLGSDALLDEVYDHPVVAARCGISESSVRATLKSMLDRHDPESAVEQNLNAIKELAERHEEIGKYVAIDGTDVPAWLDQGPDWGAGHAELLNRRVAGANHGSHGKGFWRGFVLIALTDIKSTLPLAWILAPAKTSETQRVRMVVDLLYKYWPECPVEYLVGDRGFDVPASLHLQLEECYGIHLVTPWKSDAGNGGPGDLGVPHCNCGGELTPMKLVQSDGFWPAPKRRAKGILPGEHIDLKASKARHRWSCTDCGNRENTWFSKDPRRHVYLPREGNDRRAALRSALLARRNAVESTFSLLQHRGMAGENVNVPRWVTSARQMTWLLGTALLGLTLRRLVHEAGLYDLARADMDAKGLIKLRSNAGYGRNALAIAA